MLGIDYAMQGMAVLSTGEKCENPGYYRQAQKRLVKEQRKLSLCQKCSKCGEVKETLELSERTYHCSCGNHMDRDVNAAINIREEGKRLLCVEAGDI